MRGEEAHERCCLSVLLVCAAQNLDTAKCTDSDCVIGVEHPDKHRYVRCFAPPPLSSPLLPASQPPSSERYASAAERIERANSRGSARSLLLSVWADAKINGLAVMCEQVNTMRTVEKAIKISR